ncbi:MAG: class I SAM-dependent methyltransferase [Nostocaceae cyanobacterium]|nr:class I SAM-dependent methyltransferase [Nostocaceae cyanobacterium]
MSQTNSKLTPLYMKNPLTHFSERADYYAKYRPSYPEVAIDAILEGLSKLSQVVAVDIGAGTGISSRLLGERGVRVIAIEPNIDMREVSEPSPGIEWRDGTAESTNLPDASVDLVTCFQAFHWFNPEPSLLEFQRILKPSGKLALLWNLQDRRDNFTAEYCRLASLGVKKTGKQKRRKYTEPVEASPYFHNSRKYIFVYQQELDLTGLIGRAMSSRYVPRDGLVHEQIMSGLEDLFQRYCNECGLVSLVYRTIVYLAEVIKN